MRISMPALCPDVPNTELPARVTLIVLPGTNMQETALYASQGIAWHVSGPNDKSWGVSRQQDGFQVWTNRLDWIGPIQGDFQCSSQ